MAIGAALLLEAARPASRSLLYKSWGQLCGSIIHQPILTEFQHIEQCTPLPPEIVQGKCVKSSITQPRVVWTSWNLVRWCTMVTGGFVIVTNLNLLLVKSQNSGRHQNRKWLSRYNSAAAACSILLKYGIILVHCGSRSWLQPRTTDWTGNSALIAIFSSFNVVYLAVTTEREAGFERRVAMERRVQAMTSGFWSCQPFMIPKIHKTTMAVMSRDLHGNFPAVLPRFPAAKGTQCEGYPREGK